MRDRTEKDDDGTHTYLCECGFLSSRHPTKKSATARGAEHQAEHDAGKPMRAIGEFTADQG